MGEDQNLLAGSEDGFDDLVEAGQLARPALEPQLVPKAVEAEVGRALRADAGEGPILVLGRAEGGRKQVLSRLQSTVASGGGQLAWDGRCVRSSRGNLARSIP